MRLRRLKFVTVADPNLITPFTYVNALIATWRNRFTLRQVGGCRIDNGFANLTIWYARR